MDEEFDPAAVVELTSRLVQLRTVQDGSGAVEMPAVDLIAGIMRGYGWATTVVEAAADRHSVIGVIDGDRSDHSPGRTLMFEGHVDVVTEGDRDAWSFDPFAGDIVDGGVGTAVVGGFDGAIDGAIDSAIDSGIVGGMDSAGGARVRGRGSADMKAGVAAMIHAARAVQRAGFAGRIVVGVLADEEGMMLGAKRFAADLAAGAVPGIDRIDGVIVCEPEGGEVCPVAKGAIRIAITFTGVMAHGAMPWIGRNPLPAIGSMLAAIADTQHVLRAEHGDHPLLGPICLTPTVLTAGDLEQINVVPATATLAVDIRTTPAVAHAALITELADTARRIADEHRLTADLTVIDDRPPVDTPVDHPVVAAMVAGHEAATGVAATIGGVPGATDGTILTRDAGLATVVYGPGGKWIAHQADEYVEVDDIVTCTRAYISAARHFLGCEG